QRLRLLLDAAPLGVSTTRWAQAEGLSDEASSALAAQDERLSDEALSALSMLAAQDARAADGPGNDPDHERADPHHVERFIEHDGWALADRHRQIIADATIQALRAFHARDPEMLGPDPARLRRLTSPRLPEPLWLSIIDTLKQQGRIAVRGAFVHLPEHGLRLSAIDERLSQKIAPLLANAGFEGAWARDLARDSRESEPLMRVTLARLAQRGDLHQVVKDLCYAPQTMVKLAAIVRAHAEAGEGAVTVARFRDATGLGRKRAIQIIEYFDRVGLLRRVGDEHRLRADSALFRPEPP
ncbi:MAG: selenocysteine-specific elongation factor, partial [Rhizobacter sp.]|nr:selenocysteine-specific elongation factor [Rhizobacter sp.]